MDTINMGNSKSLKHNLTKNVCFFTQEMFEFYIVLHILSNSLARTVSQVSSIMTLEKI